MKTFTVCDESGTEVCRADLHLDLEFGPCYLLYYFGVLENTNLPPYRYHLYGESDAEASERIRDMVAHAAWKARQ